MPRLLPLLVALVTLAAGASEAAVAFTIRTKQGAITRIGPMKTTGVNGGRVTDATEAFGPASRIAPVGSGAEACRIEILRLWIGAAGD